MKWATSHFDENFGRSKPIDIRNHHGPEKVPASTVRINEIETKKVPNFLTKILNARERERGKARVNVR